MTLVAIDDLKDINKKIEKGSDEIQDVEDIISSIEEFVKNKEDNIELLESTINSLTGRFAKEKVNLNDKEMRDTLESLLKSMERWLKRNDEVLARANTKTPFAQVVEILKPGLINRLNCIVEEYDDFAENIRLCLAHTDELKELESLSEEYSVKAMPINMDKWSEEI